MPRPYQTGAHATSTGIPGVFVSSPGHGPVIGEPTEVQATKNMRRFATDVRAAVAAIRAEANPAPQAAPDVAFVALAEPTELEYALLMGGEAGMTKGYNEVHDGRWPFRLVVEQLIHVVEMPGLPTSQVRYTGAKRQRIFDFPRVFASGSSWTWNIATRHIAHAEESYA